MLQPNKENYVKHAPPDSFIHAEDFEFDSMKLADFLKKVSSDIELYKKYFKWKKLYKPAFDAHTVEQARICELCYRLNTRKIVGYYSSLYKEKSRQQTD